MCSIQNNAIDITVVPNCVIHTGNNDLELLKSSISLFPNPCKNTTNLNIELSGSAPIVVRIYSLAGKALMSLNLGVQNIGNTIHEIDISELSKGIYILDVLMGSISEKHQLVKI